MPPGLWCLKPSGYKTGKEQVSITATSCQVDREWCGASLDLRDITHEIPDQGFVGRADWIKSDTDWFDLWVVTRYKFRPTALLQFYQILLYFRQKLLPIFDSRREDRPIQPLHEVIPIHQGHRDEVEPGGRSVKIFRTPWIDTFLDELLALFSCEHRVLGRLWSILRYEGCMELVATIVENTNLLQAILPRQINQSEEGELQECVQGQWRCKIECASPAFRSKVDEADWGDEPQERDHHPDDDELDQSVANHCLQRSSSSS